MTNAEVPGPCTEAASLEAVIAIVVDLVLVLLVVIGVAAEAGQVSPKFALTMFLASAVSSGSSIDTAHARRSFAVDDPTSRSPAPFRAIGIGQNDIAIEP